MLKFTFLQFRRLEYRIFLIQKLCILPCCLLIALSINAFFSATTTSAAAQSTTPTLSTTGVSCSHSRGKASICNVQLSNDGSQQNLLWSSSSDTSGVSFHPASGTLAAGKSLHITVTIPDCTPNETISLSFQGQTNTSLIPIFC